MPKKKDPATEPVTATKAAPKPRKKATPASSAPESLPMNLLAEEALIQYEFTPDAIAVRAYFLGEKRRAEGLHPDPVHDWLQAESEILSELENHSAPKKKSTRKSK